MTEKEKEWSQAIASMLRYVDDIVVFAITIALSEMNDTEYNLKMNTAKTKAPAGK